MSTGNFKDGEQIVSSNQNVGGVCFESSIFPALLVDGLGVRRKKFPPRFLVVDSHLPIFCHIDRERCFWCLNPETHPPLLFVRAFPLDFSRSVFKAVFCFLVVHNRKCRTKRWTSTLVPRVSHLSVREIRIASSESGDNRHTWTRLARTRGSPAA